MINQNSAQLNFEINPSTGQYEQVGAVPAFRLVRGFLDYKRIESAVSDLTLESYAHGVNHFCSWLQKRRGKDPLAADSEDLHKYFAAPWRSKLKPASIAHRMSVLREFFNHLQRDGLIRRDPMIRIEGVKKWKRLPKPITEDEVRQLLDASRRPELAEEGKRKRGWPQAAKQSPAIELRDVAILEVAYAGGLRVSEVTSAQLTDLNFDLRCLRVTGKGDKQRMVPLGLSAMRAVRKYLIRARRELSGTVRSPYLFIGHNGDQLTRQRVWQIIGERSKRAGIAHVSPHMLRHSAATHLLDHGADIRVIQTILGHADISTTECYTKVSQERLHEAIKAHHPRNNPKYKQLSLVPTSALMLADCFVPSPCSECAEPSVPGKSRCAKHMLTAKEACARLYAKRTDAGLCKDCGRPAIPETTLCEQHTIAQRKAVQRYRARKSLRILPA